MATTMAGIIAARSEQHQAQSLRSRMYESGRKARLEQHQVPCTFGYLTQLGRPLSSRQRDKALRATVEGLEAGQVIALQGRKAETGNGSFESGDIGRARWHDDGTVRILWPNETESRTAWPNTAWYRGSPAGHEPSADKLVTRKGPAGGRAELPQRLISI
mmetsp:Transcript_17753/g.53423  ORF Transcript_17753/g.53423 Transcript_17753/m.53423 type:complete len:160 (+) Transcript_17753:58-537(+)